jgi:hypothetical protein
MRRTVLICALAGIVAIALPLAHLSQAAEQKSAKDIKDAKPSGTVELEAEQLRLILGGGSGKGVLTYQGKQYPFTFKGASVGGVGVAKSSAVGEVYFLKKLEDFPGRYTSVGAGATVGVGAGRSAYENDKGVFVSLRSKTEGLALTLGLQTVTVEFVK